MSIPFNDREFAEAAAVASGYIRITMKNAFSGRFALAGIFLFLAAPFVFADSPLSRTEQVLWTSCTITLYDHADPAILDAVFARLHEIDSRLSVNIKGSELDAASDAAGKTAVHVSSDVRVVIDKALQLAALTNGLFDPTVGPLMKVWNMNTGNGRIPEPAQIAEVKGLVNWRDVVLDSAAGTLFVKRAGMRLDAGGLLKGYAADEVVSILSARGVKNAIVDLGGDIFAKGSRSDGAPWQIGIQNPDEDEGVTLGVVAAVDKSVVTSGVYEHYFVQNGKRYSHIMDTRTGGPVDNGLTSVTVIADKSIDADGIALSIFCLGTVDGLALAAKLGVDTVIVTSDDRLYVSDGAKRLLTVTDPRFIFAQ